MIDSGLNHGAMALPDLARGDLACLQFNVGEYLEHAPPDHPLAVFDHDLTPAEVGRLLIALAAVCVRQGIDMRRAALCEFDRVCATVPG